MEFNVFFVIFTTMSLSPTTAGVIQEKVTLTMYWCAHELEFAHEADILIKTCSGKPLAAVSKTFADKIQLEGSGMLRNGKVVNLSYCNCKGGYNCFELVTAPLGSRDNPLESFVSVATNDIAFGTKLYVKEMDGISLPNRKKHNGCVRVDDACSSCSKNQIDLYVPQRSDYYFLDDHYSELHSVTIQEKPSCLLLSY